MKIYLTLVIISAICYIMVEWESAMYLNEHYTRIGKSSISRKMHSMIMSIILTLLIFCPICAFLVMTFNRNEFYSALDNKIKESENWEEKMKRVDN